MSRLFGQITPILPARASKASRIFEKARRRNQDRAIARQFGAVGDMDEQIGW